LVTEDGSGRVAAEIANLTTLAFYSLDAKGVLVANKKFGTVKVLSTEPFEVKYTIADGLKWSDGQPVDEADLVLSFAAATDAGDAAFNSIRKSSGLQFATIKEVGARSITLSFSQAVADYETALTVSAPAHIVANDALAGIEYSAGKQAVISAVEGNDKPKLASLAISYASVYDVRVGNLAEGATVSNGAYQITELEKGASVTLKAKAKFSAGHLPTIETVVVRAYGDATAAVSAMYAGDVEVISATESGLAKLTDVLSLVAALPEGSANTKIKNSGNADMMLLNFGADSIFADGSDQERTELLREAMLNLVPKAASVLAANSDYEVSQSDSFVFPHSSRYYSASKVANGSQSLLFQDVEKASELVKASKVRTPQELRVIYDKSNPRSKAQFALLSQRALSAGFEVVDTTPFGFTAVIASGEFDLYIGPMPLLGVPGNSPTAVLAGITGYSDSKVEGLLSEYALTKTAVQHADILTKIDKELFASGYGIPLVEVPNLVIYSSKLKTFTPSPFGNSSTWGYWTWSLSTK
jgi:peptide/nickel transport system substrate-binding protein